MSEAAVLQTQTAKAPPSNSHSLLVQRKCACGGSSGLTGSCYDCDKKKLLGQPLQTKLRINEPGDEYEQEADRVAEQVMRMAEPEKHTNTSKAGTAPLVQRKVNANAARIGSAPAIVHDVLSSPGQPLDTATRAFFETRIGHDFSAIRIHADSHAAESARSVNARAFTVGSHVVLGAGEYAPQSAAGQRLLAHELVHSVQQCGGANRPSVDGARRPSISRNPERVLNRWRIEGTEGIAEEEGESLKKLAKMLNAEAESWVCIRPINMTLASNVERPADFNEHYDRYVFEGDRFDLSNLLASTGPSFRLHILNEAPINTPYVQFLNVFYPGVVQSADPDVDIDLASGDGLTPIKNLILVGHAGGSVMTADASGNGKFSPVAVEKDSPDRPPSYERITGAVPTLPRRCWFTRDASVRAVGCDSVDFGINFARVYLRRGAKIITTTAAVRGVCAESTNCSQLKAVDFGMREVTPDEDMTETRVEGPFFNPADFHAADHWAIVVHRGVRGWGIVRGREGNGARPASEILGETGEQQVAAIRELLSTDVSDQEVRDVLTILRSWGDEEIIASAWLVIGEKQLRRFLDNLKVDDHFVDFPLEVLASVAALDDATRNRKILNRTRGITSRRDAALAFFLVMELDPADPEQMEALLGRRPARAQRRESRIAERIQSALPYEVRVALVEAVNESAARKEQNLPKEPSAFTVELGNFSNEAAAEVIRQVEEHLQGVIMPSAEEQREYTPDVVPTAEFLYVALRWLTEQRQDQLIAEIHEHLGSLDPYIAWIEWIVTPDAQYIKDRTSEQYRIALTKVLAQAAAPFADLIVGSLSRGRVTEKEARNAFGAFACLLGASSAQEPPDTLCAGGLSQLGLVRGTVQRLEELQVTNAWLEKLARTSGINLEEPTNASVLNQVLSFRLPTLALSHVTQLLRADQRDPKIPREDALLARKIIEAQPAAAAAAMRLELSAHPNGDLTTRLAVLTEFETERIVEAGFDDWLRAYREAVTHKRWEAIDLLEVLYVRPGEAFNPAPDFPLQPANRDLASDLAELDRLSVFDAVLDQVVTSEIVAPRAALAALIPYRSPAANISTMRRLIGPAPTKLQAQLAFEIQRAMPPEAQSRLKADEGLWGRMTEALPAAFIESPTFGPKVELKDEDKTIFLSQLDDPGIWMKSATGGLSPTLSVMLTLAIQAGRGPEVTGIIEKHWDDALAEDLGKKGFFRPDPLGPVRFSEEVVVHAVERARDTTGVLGKLAGSKVTGQAVVIEADNLADWLSEGQGIFLDVTAPEQKPAIGAPNTFAINWFEREGIVQAFASELSVSGSNAIFDSAVMRSGGGFLEGLTLHYKYKERVTPDQLSSMSADVLELHDITIATHDSVYGVGLMRIEGASVSADLKTGKPVVLYKSRIGALTDLLFVFYDALFAVIDIVTESILPDGKVKGAEALATSIVARFRNRIALNAQADSVLLEGVVVPGLGSIDRLSMGDETDPAVNALALSLTSNVDWHRLSDLRKRWSRGEALTEEEQKERMILERQVLSLALNLEVAPFQAVGVRSVLLDKAKSPDITLALDVIAKERTSVNAVLDSVKRGVEIPTEQGIPGTSTPLAALAALDDGVFKARLDLLHGVIGETSMTPGVEQRGAPGVSVEPGGMTFEGGRIIILPDGTLYVEATDALVKQLALRVRDYGVELNVRDLKVGRSTAQRIGAEIGALAQPAAGFPAGKPGDWLVTLGEIQVIDVGLAIADVMKLGPAASPASCKSPEFLKLLDGLSGILNVTLSVTVPAPSVLGGPTTAVQHVPVDLIIAGGMVTIQVTGPGANFVHGALHAFGINATIPNPLSVIFGKAYESFMCTPPATPAASVSGTSPPPATWGEQLKQWTQAGLDAIKQGAQDVLQQALNLTEIDVRSHNLRWKMSSVDLTDIATKLQLEWYPGQPMPLDLHLRFVPAPNGPGRMELTFHPFTLDRAVGEAKGTPVLIDDLRFTRDLMLTVDFTGSGKPIPAAVPLEGIELRELRLLLPAK